MNTPIEQFPEYLYSSRFMEFVTVSKSKEKICFNETECIDSITDPLFIIEIIQQTNRDRSKFPFREKSSSEEDDDDDDDECNTNPGKRLCPPSSDDRDNVERNSVRSV
ncbi:hypothetical protein RUM44_007021 [Polyplax serrata]|uniref:Uncharacterized protein n=1 Tax=Polyplax serrata TaxID=468196 RepID=A0ABR1AZI9_POLSC